MANSLSAVIDELKKNNLNVVAIVADGAAVITKAIKLLNDHNTYQQKYNIMRIFCYCHTLNLIMMDIIKEFNLDG